MRERGFRAEVRDFHALLDAQACADDLLEHRPNRLARKRAGVVALKPVDERSLALRSVEVPGTSALGFGNVLRQARALIEKSQETFVHRVDARAKL